MAEIRRGLGGDAGGGGERLPWLEPVEDEDDYPEGGGLGGVAIVGLAALIAIALLVTAFILVRRWHARHADVGQVIHAPATPYKVKPADPGGLAVDKSGVVAERTGTGNDLDAPLDLSALPEQPVAGPGSGQPSAPAPAPDRSASAPVPPKPQVASAPPVPAAPAIPLKPAPAPVAEPPVARDYAAPAAIGGSGTIQLGALNSEAKAKSVWKALSGRFGYLAPLAMSITPVKVGDATLYRLRASGGDSRALCARLKIAGETCAVVN